MRTIETKLYTIDEHPNAELCFDYMRKIIYNSNESALIDALHSEIEYVYSDKELREMCENNGWEFTEDGKLF